MSFSESKQNLQYLSIQRRVLWQVGIDLNAKRGKNLLIHYWKFILIVINMIYVQCGLLNFIIDSSSNLDVTTASMSAFNQCCLILLKIAIFLYKGDDFLILIWKINQLAENANSKEYKKWLSENKQSHLITKIYHYTCLISVSCAYVLPLFFMAHDYYNEMEVGKKLPFGGKFPYDNGSILYFVINYILSVVFVSCLLNMTVGIDSLFGWYIYGISAHFQILRLKVEHVASMIDNDEDHGDFVKDVGRIVAYHNKILMFADDLNDIFGGIILMEVLLSCLQMCFVIYTVNNDTDLSNMPFNLTICVALMIQLMIYCFGGEKLKNESNFLCNDFYLLFPWHKMSPKEKKLMLLPLMRSQRESSLQGLIFEADRNLLVYILKTAFSFNTLLAALKEQ